MSFKPVLIIFFSNERSVYATETIRMSICIYLLSLCFRLLMFSGLIGRTSVKHYSLMEIDILIVSVLHKHCSDC